MAPSGLRFEVMPRAPSDVRRVWLDWTRSAGPFARPAFFDAWCSAFASTRIGFLVAGYRGRDLQLLLPMWHPRGDSTKWSSLGAFRADYTDTVPASADPAVGTAFWNWLAVRAPCHMARVARLHTDGLLGRTLLGRRSRAYDAAVGMLLSRRVRYLTPSEHREHPFADRGHVVELAARLGSKETRRKVNVLARGGEVRYRVIRGRAALTELLPSFFALHVASFASTNRRSQFESADERAFYASLVAAPELEHVVHMDVLTVGNRAAAMHFGFQCGDWIYWYKPAFDVELAKGSPGRVLLAHMFARGRDERVEGIDLLKGDEPYKADWANRTRPTVSATLTERELRQLVRRITRRLESVTKW